MAHTFTSYIAIGDSFTEGNGDELPDGTPRGWADFVALGLAVASAPQAVTYANLAIRGRKLAPIVGEQLDAALAQHPALLSINGGGNDLMRPRVTIGSVANSLYEAARPYREGERRHAVASISLATGRAHPRSQNFMGRGVATSVRSTRWTPRVKHARETKSTPPTV